MNNSSKKNIKPYDINDKFDVALDNIYHVKINEDESYYKFLEIEKLIDETIEKLCFDLNVLIKNKHTNKSKLAKSLGVSRANITHLLNGKTSFTIKTLVKLVQEINPDYKIQIDIVKKNKG